MARLTHPVTGRQVDVQAHDRTLLEYYRGEGYVEAGDSLPAETPNVVETKPASAQASSSLDLDEDEHDDEDTSSQTDADGSTAS